MTLDELVRRTRSIRRFDQAASIPPATLEELVDLARLAASAANLQPLKYILSNDPATNARIFETLAWAGYIEDWPGPPEGERPAAYIVMLGDLSISRTFGCDPGIAAQNMLLGATERGLGGCLIGSIRREDLGDLLKISESLQILLVLALGRPAERVVIETLAPDGSVKYWRDREETHHVPKRGHEEIIVKRFPEGE